MTRNQKYYREQQERIRDEAIDFQYWKFEEENEFEFEEINNKTEYFEKMGKRYGLLEEFRENLVI